jgi:hypothetical protein
MFIAIHIAPSITWIIGFRFWWETVQVQVLSGAESTEKQRLYKAQALF